MTYTLPSLPYAYEALEPHFDAQTMTIHHQRHHQAYIDNLNKAIAGTPAETKGLEELLKEVSKYSPAVRNNAGGHYNHSLFWNILSPAPQTTPGGQLAFNIDMVFGSLDNLKAEIKKAGLAQFGSGWAWLFVKFNGTIGVTATANQDNPLMDTNLTNRGIPILGVDVWEHAYYLKYQNKRADYLDAFWSVLDWSAVEKNYNEVIAKLK
ncbi:superoxide dismutase [Niastella yeongjuensis]|uniref:Superoxide dismutase n=1 Tax=Niastella yeongjuensis TaxID=354355 RepID=A0A1V9E9F6_9BACT|nr:superoxide dismutase [Niastella yeongjuensis]OQP42757.1 superoxide dismutase [Niastella yeongjuensis]SEO52635.1 superoxide dismutase, Fe-Mn family [Niastella yeongjuensis]